MYRVFLAAFLGIALFVGTAAATVCPEPYCIDRDDLLVLAVYEEPYEGPCFPGVASIDWPIPIPETMADGLDDGSSRLVEAEADDEIIIIIIII